MNDLFGYTISIPSSYVINDYDRMGSGITASDPDTNQISVVVWGSNNTDHASLDARMQAMADPTALDPYTASGDTWFVYSYESDGLVYYIKEYVGTGSINHMSICYPSSLSATGDALVEALEPTFEPGDLSTRH